MDQFQDEIQQIKNILKESGRGMSITEIARALNKNNHSVGRYLDNLLVSGQVEMRTYGKAKVFSLSRRVPFDTMMGFAEDLIFVLDYDNRIVRINNQVLTFFGKKRSEFIGKNIEYLSFSESWTNAFFTSIRSSLINGPPDSEIRIQKNDGIVFRQKIIPTVFEDGKKGITILLEDITAKKAAGLALQQSEEQFRLMAENIQDGIIIKKGKKGKETCYINRRTEEIFGYTREEFATIDPLDLAAPDERDRIRNLMAESISTESIPSELTFWILRKDGARRFISSRITSVKHADEVIYYIVATDMTEWKHAQEALENQLGFLQHTINTFPNPLFFIDPEGRYLGCNSAFCTLISKTIKEIAGKTTEEIIPGDQVNLFTQHNDSLVKKSGVITYSGVFHTTDNSWYNVSIQKSSLNMIDGTIAGVVGLILSMGPMKPQKTY